MRENCGGLRPPHSIFTEADIGQFCSIISSAMAMSDGGTDRPSILAVWALMTSISVS